MSKPGAPSSKKPPPLFTSPRRAACPVCGKAAYSLGGVHPQCAVARENSREQKERKAELAAAAPPPRPPSSWMKRCTRCGAINPAHRMTCTCGYVFAPAQTLQIQQSAEKFVQDARDTPTPSQKVDTMRDSPVSDKALAQQVNQKLASRGIRSPCKVSVGAAHGDVTLNGSVQHAHQKTAAVQTAAAMAGVRRVIDLLTVKPHLKR